MRRTYELEFELDRKKTAWNKGVKGWWSDEHRARCVAAARRDKIWLYRRVPIVVEDTSGRRYFFNCLKKAAVAIGRSQSLLKKVLSGKKKLGHELTGYKIYKAKKI